MTWAHCFRVYAGINTNMAIDSLHKVLKHNKMSGNQNIRIEKLLDLLEEIVNEKMWKKILNTERPSANNYQHKTTVTDVGNLGEENLGGTLYIQEPTVSRIRYQFELYQYLEEKKNDASKSIAFERRQQIASEEVNNYMKSLDEQSFAKFMDMFRTFKNNLQREKTDQISKKRKTETQTYYPNKR